MRPACRSRRAGFRGDSFDEGGSFSTLLSRFPFDSGATLLPSLKKRPPSARFVTSATSSSQFPKDGLPEIAFLGRSNVGKSSLLNALTGAKGLARVSSTPGRTQMVNFFRLGDEMYFADLPGYGYAKVPESVRRSFEALAVSYLRERDPLALGLLLIDSRHEAQPGDETLARWLDHEGVFWAIAATKADKLGPSERARRKAQLEKHYGRPVILTSAETLDGIDDLWKVIRTAAEAHRTRS